eukprot:6186190-Pleurochrysis_carterae.AAC.1
MRHATRAGNKPSFWTYLKVNGCGGCQKQEEQETIQHVLGGGCKAIGKNKNNRYREEMKRALEKCKKLMNDKHNSEGIIQAERAFHAIKRPRKHTDPMIKEKEELALRQMISGIIHTGMAGG